MRQYQRPATATAGGRQIADEVAHRQPAGGTAGHPAERAAGHEETVRFRAYLAWEAAGRPPGDGVEFWLLAERAMGEDGNGTPGERGR